jgi:hypothetical protein
MCYSGMRLAEGIGATCILSPVWFRDGAKYAQWWNLRLTGISSPAGHPASFSLASDLISRFSLGEGVGIALYHVTISPVCCN